MANNKSDEYFEKVLAEELDAHREAMKRIIEDESTDVGLEYAYDSDCYCCPCCGCDCGFDEEDMDDDGDFYDYEYDDLTDDEYDELTRRLDDIENGGWIAASIEPTPDGMYIATDYEGGRVRVCDSFSDAMDFIMESGGE